MSFLTYFCFGLVVGFLFPASNFNFKVMFFILLLSGIWDMRKAISEIKKHPLSEDKELHGHCPDCGYVHQQGECEEVGHDKNNST